ncbi:MAG: hypothetical protein IPK16_23515 [Anaerolineales bacterium]|nr:hypothetical protein [Anaerolineales bacterium]
MAAGNGAPDDLVGAVLRVTPGVVGHAQGYSLTVAADHIELIVDARRSVLWRPDAGADFEPGGWQPAQIAVRIGRLCPARCDAGH